MRRVNISLPLLLLLALWLPSARLAAQCQRVGWVASVIPGCGVKIIDLDNGEILRAVEGADALLGGQTIRFSAAPAALPSGCAPTALPTVALTCISDTLPCSAQFGYAPDPQTARNYIFEASIYDASAQTCTWNFGDGSTATGKSVEHTFASEGDFEVCLSVSDPLGCSAQACQIVEVNDQIAPGCHYSIEVTAVGTQLYAKASPLYNNPDQILTSITWYTSKSSQILSQASAFSAPLPGYGEYLVCAQITTANVDNGATCTTTLCQALTVAEPGCVMQHLADEYSGFCVPVFAPVCGCNGVTYANECEAKSAGLASWWAGPCAAAFGTCTAQLEATVLAGTPDDGYTVQFRNLSVGEYTFAQLDFGDGSPLWEDTQWDTVVHHYAVGDIYPANLTTWKTGGCLSSATQLVMTDALSMTLANIPGNTDYVLPGDANGDQKANAHDILHLGLGHYATGAPRPYASTAWAHQFAPNWDHSVAQAVNYKHLDCDGNGVVNVFDADVTAQHYVALDTTPVAFLPNAPKVWLEFAQDTLYVDPNNPQPLSIEAKVMLGSPTQPALGIYGLGFALRYPDYVAHDPDTDYDGDLFGSINHMLWLAEDIHPRRQLDLALTRTNGLAANGYGQIADITFKSDYVIVIDVIGRSENANLPFSVPVKNLKAMDAYGNEMDLSVPASLDTVWIKSLATSAVNEQNLAESIHLYPNPATGAATLLTGDLQVERIEIANALGQILRNVPPSGSRATRLEIADWQLGVYTLRILTDRGLAEKRLVVK
jgi:PKD repeat protein